jgi:predicted molibdopterin-dependent oxidoreductase YjgC
VLKGISAAILKLGHAKGKQTLNIEKCMEAASKAGVSEEKLVDAGNLIGSALKPVFIYGKGVTTQNGSPALKALLELAEITGALTKDYSAVIGTKGEANSMAAVQFKLDKPFKVNGHQAVYLTLGDHNTSQRLLERLTKVPFLVVQASHTSQITSQADVILPVETWSEQEGHYVNLEGRLQMATKSMSAPDDVQSNDTVLKSLANRLGLKVDNKWKEKLTERTPTVAIVDN